MGNFDPKEVSLPVDRVPGLENSVFKMTSTKLEESVLSWSLKRAQEQTEPLSRHCTQHKELFLSSLITSQTGFQKDKRPFSLCHSIYNAIGS